jgi:peptidoglycan-N-acetylglucosamine deacetylase
MKWNKNFIIILLLIAIFLLLPVLQLIEQNQVGERLSERDPNGYSLDLYQTIEEMESQYAYLPTPYERIESIGLKMLIDQSYRNPIKRIPQSFAENAMVLTFDLMEDGDNETPFNRNLLEALHRKKVPITLFVTGEWIKNHPEESLYLKTNSYIELACLGYDSTPFTDIGSPILKNEIYSSLGYLYSLKPVQHLLIRTPYGLWDEMSRSLVKRLGLIAVGWSISPDYSFYGLRDYHIYATLKWEAEAGSILCLKLNQNVEAINQVIPLLIDNLRSRGYTFGFLSKMLLLD